MRSITTLVGAARFVTWTQAGILVPATQFMTASKSPVRTSETSVPVGSPTSNPDGPS